MIIPSIDLMDGKAVQLRQGAEKVLEVTDPHRLAAQFNRYGESAVIDLDAALGQGDNRALIAELLALADCRVGGGIRTVAQAREWIALGAKKVIIGSLAFANDQINHAFLSELSAAISPQRLILAIDARDGEIVTQGWRHRTGLPVVETVAALEPYAGEFLFTAVEREGMMAGVDHAAIERVRRATSRKLTAAGGITTLQEVAALAARDVDVQVGMALYTGALDLTEAFIAGLNWKHDLLPTIVQDEAGDVLMLAYSNRDSLRATFAQGEMVYFSRSRQQLWHKGATSGHRQRLLRMRVDCDRDTILATVAQQGVACHTGQYSCFGDPPFSFDALYRVVDERLTHAPAGSYTATLRDEAQLAAKLMEEAQEVVDARTDEEIIWEAADLLYFLTVRLAKAGLSFDQVARELHRRRWQ
ncbi:MAG: bifunctional phosphoribosyl-AMP cyclohydrolase/phosphoribosyl-ATP diphosphatase HisIE [Anaerolineales bacterium]|nr:bifunctional phosphoribosyl-AMP cyclohydrolase/phosphoribosyl-ATP diphosphatase HisIE [Anaerolineales bacterium]MCB9126490.1 bifunctional phosphoribosyl-AMP cyclohydrolase/phosphoribosyl-ATP diphosphatase HisIE [Ardenticatenales bacterium]